VNKDPNIENLKPFKKGQTGNPNGRPRKLISQTINELKAEGVVETSTTEIKAVYLMLINLTIPELEQRVKDSKQSALVRIVGKAILSNKGYEIIEKMLDRAIGKAENKIDHTTNGKEMNQSTTFVVATDDTRNELKKLFDAGAGEEDEANEDV
jgi:hypothetical protein